MIGGYFGYQRYRNQKTPVSISTETTQDQPVATDNSVIDPENVTNPQITTLNAVYKLPEGEQSYSITHGEKIEGPKASGITFSPLSFKKGETQKISVTFPTSEIVSSAVIFFNTDSKEKQKVVLKKIDASGSAVWSGSWMPDDTVTTKYSANLYFVGPSGTYNSIMNFL
jgi:hypothetical protein